MKYRPEIDGLRALAVLPVIVHHTQSSLLPGGAAGVDVFFVISGFLITQIILNDLKSGTWSLSRFYERRARRIFPALFTMLGVCLVWGWVTMLPFDFERHVLTTVSAVFFVSNFLFLDGVDYFAEGPETDPLIHTWSLGVEEQYYLIFPLMMIFAWKLVGPRKREVSILSLLVGLMILSLLLANWGAQNEREANFFFTPSRVWELLAGAIAAILYMRQTVRKAQVMQWGAALGLALLIVSYVALGQSKPFPSFWTVLPVLGAVLLTYCSSSQGFVGRLLASKLLVGIGVISYSLYLWHQPILAFLRIANPEVQPSTLWGGAILTFPVAFLSWKFVEQPFRGKLFPLRRITHLLGGGAVVLVSLSSAVLVFQPTTLAFQRLDVGQKQIVPFVGARLDQTDLYMLGTCFVDGPFPTPDTCRAPNPFKTDVILWGDSHAAGLAVGMRQIVSNFGSYSIMRCPLFVADTNEITEGCRQANLQTLEQIDLVQPSTVVLHRNWIGHQTEINTLGSTVEKIRSLSPETRIVLLGGVPQWPEGLPELLLVRDISIIAENTIATELSELRQVDAFLEDAATAAGVDFVSALDLLCVDERCRAVEVLPNGSLEPSAFDYGHLTEAGARALTLLLGAELNLHLN